MGLERRSQEMQWLVDGNPAVLNCWFGSDSGLHLSSPGAPQVQRCRWGSACCGLQNSHRRHCPVASSLQVLTEGRPRHGPSAERLVVRGSLCTTRYSQTPWKMCIQRSLLLEWKFRQNEFMCPEEEHSSGCTYCHGSSPTRRMSFSRSTNTSCQPDLTGSSSWPSRPNNRSSSLRNS